MTKNIELELACTWCSKPHKLTVDEEGFKQWHYGQKLIQEALPNLTTAERELLLSQLCSTCFNNATNSYDDDHEYVIETATTKVEVDVGHEVPEIDIRLADNIAQVKVNDVVVYGNRKNNLKFYGNLSWTRQDVMGLENWKRSEDAAEQFLQQHAALLTDALREYGQAFLNQLAQTWEGTHDDYN